MFTGANTPTRHGTAGRKGRRRGQIGLKKKKQRVRRNVQIEIHKTVQQNRANSSKRRGVKRGGKMALFGHERSSRAGNQQKKKSDAAETTQYPGLSERLDIVVVDMVHYQAIVVGVVARKDRNNRAQSNAFHGMIQKNVLRASKH